MAVERLMNLMALGMLTKLPPFQSPCPPMMPPLLGQRDGPWCQTHQGPVFSALFTPQAVGGSNRALSVRTENSEARNEVGAKVGGSESSPAIGTMRWTLVQNAPGSCFFSTFHAQQVGGSNRALSLKTENLEVGGSKRGWVGGSEGSPAQMRRVWSMQIARRGESKNI